MGSNISTTNRSQRQNTAPYVDNPQIGTLPIDQGNIQIESNSLVIRDRNGNIVRTLRPNEDGIIKINPRDNTDLSKISLQLENGQLYLSSEDGGDIPLDIDRNGHIAFWIRNGEIYFKEASPYKLNQGNQQNYPQNNQLYNVPMGTRPLTSMSRYQTDMVDYWQ